MTKYKQLSQEQRYSLTRLIESGNNQTDIALVIGCYKSTISREIKGNVPKRGKSAKQYNPG